MAKGITLASGMSAVHAQLLDELRGPLLLALIERLGGTVTVPLEELEAIGEARALAIDLDDESGGVKLELSDKKPSGVDDEEDEVATAEDGQSE